MVRKSVNILTSLSAVAEISDFVLLNTKKLSQTLKNSVLLDTSVKLKTK
jgi:hypothetical protein